jgi:hypothetical protein
MLMGTEYVAAPLSSTLNSPEDNPTTSAFEDALTPRIMSIIGSNNLWRDMRHPYFHVIIKVDNWNLKGGKGYIDTFNALLKLKDKYSTAWTVFNIFPC